jgi:hypothetical protein
MEIGIDNCRIYDIISTKQNDDKENTIMFVCIECGRLFEKPIYWEETHGLNSSPFEKWSGCPKCYGAYTEAHQCDCCDEWIIDDYIKTEDGQRYCSECYQKHEIGDED